MGQIRHYLDAVLWAGGLPLMIPTIADRAVLSEYVGRVDGILLPGSPTDIDPVHYGAAPHEKLGRLYPERDATDFAILDLCAGEDLPILAICFGVQSLNVHRGGSLVQDIPSVVNNAAIHDEKVGKPAAKHLVQVAQDSLIGRLAGRVEVEVNSYHHQSVERLGRDLRAVATAPDGVVEAVEDTTGSFIVGVQWHPERGWKDDPFSKALFNSFIERAGLRYNPEP
jgi:putative glutamine amidotransferase